MNKTSEGTESAQRLQEAFEREQDALATMNALAAERAELLQALIAMEERFGGSFRDRDEQPKTFGCHHTAESCGLCEGLVSGWKAVKSARCAIDKATGVAAGGTNNDIQRAALAAQPGAVGEWKRAPVEPTVQMAQALIDYKGDDEMQWPSHVSPNFALAAYRIMLAAAPTEAKPAIQPICDGCGKTIPEHDALLRCKAEAIKHLPSDDSEGGLA